MRGKSIGGERIPYRDPLVLPQKEAGPWAIHRIAPTRIQPGDGVLALCPPVPRNGKRLMIFPRNALASWPGNSCNSIGLTPTCRKVGNHICQIDPFRKGKVYCFQTFRRGDSALDLSGSTELAEVSGRR